MDDMYAYLCRLDSFHGSPLCHCTLYQCSRTLSIAIVVSNLLELLFQLIYLFLPLLWGFGKTQQIPQWGKFIRSL